MCSEMCRQQVLMVDDVPFNLIPLEGMLEAKDIKFTSCFTGREAVRLFAMKLTAQCCQSTYQIVLTDIQMPEVDGF